MNICNIKITKSICDLYRCWCKTCDVNAFVSFYLFMIYIPEYKQQLRVRLFSRLTLKSVTTFLCKYYVHVVNIQLGELYIVQLGVDVNERSEKFILNSDEILTNVLHKSGQEKHNGSNKWDKNCLSVWRTGVHLGLLCGVCVSQSLDHCFSGHCTVCPIFLYGTHLVSSKFSERTTQWFLNYLALSIPDEGYSRNASCVLNLISTSLLLFLIQSGTITQDKYYEKISGGSLRSFQSCYAFFMVILIATSWLTSFNKSMSKNRQCNDQIKRTKGQAAMIYKTKDWATRTPLKIWGWTQVPRKGRQFLIH